MEYPTILLPVICRTCGAETLTEFPTLVVTVALSRWNHMALYSSCHEGTWDASPLEVKKLREFVGAQWLTNHQRRTSHSPADISPLWPPQLPRIQ